MLLDDISSASTIDAMLTAAMPLSSAMLNLFIRTPNAVTRRDICPDRRTHWYATGRSADVYLGPYCDVLADGGKNLRDERLDVAAPYRVLAIVGSGDHLG